MTENNLVTSKLAAILEHLPDAVIIAEPEKAVYLNESETPINIQWVTLEVCLWSRLIGRAIKRVWLSSELNTTMVAARTAMEASVGDGRDGKENPLVAHANLTIRVDTRPSVWIGRKRFLRESENNCSVRGDHARRATNAGAMTNADV